ncbi:MAG: HAD family hydrolase [Ignavibacteriales bacterium]|nr:HAD family hydrolase [Ignavibacteriales bacterium]
MLDTNRLKKIELVVFDLDGTLLNQYARIGEETIEYVKELKKLGVHFTFATGRLHNSITEYAEILKLQTPLISLDGAIIKSYPGNEIIYESYLKEKYVRRALEMSDKYLLKIALSHHEAIYYTEANSLIPQLMEQYEAKFEVIDSYETIINETLEIVITGDFRDSIKMIEAKMQFPYAFNLKTSFYKSQDQDGVYFLEIRNKNCSKGDGLLKLLKYLKLNINKTAVIGDWYNDRSLFRTKALKIAVANAVDDIKNMADFITKRTNEEDGTAEFLEMILKAKKS